MRKNETYHFSRSVIIRDSESASLSKQSKDFDISFNLNNQFNQIIYYKYLHYALIYPPYARNARRINIYSYQDKRVATGYQRIVTTWQGMYFEMRESDVD